jgi:hypothetical protein
MTMAKKTRKLSLKRETLRSLTEDQLGIVGGGTAVAAPGDCAGGGLKGTVPSGTSKITDGCGIIVYQYEYQYR